MHTKIAIAFATMTLAGCAGPSYYNPNVSQQQADMDAAQCNMTAAAGGGLPIDLASAAMSGMQRAEIQRLCFQSKGYRRVGSDEAKALRRPIAPVNPTYTFCDDGIARETCE